jgi:hypothetical protein
MAVLVVVALFWGNCFSCPQLLLSAAQHKCCHRTKAPKSECNTQGLQNFVKAEKAAPASSLPVTVAAVDAPALTMVNAVELAPRPVLYSPSHALPLRI